MSKRQSRAAIFKGKFLNTLRNLSDTPAAQRDPDWGRRAVGFAAIRVKEAEELLEQADAVLRAADGSAGSLPNMLGTEDHPISHGRTPLHTGVKVLNLAAVHASEALRTLEAVRAAKLPSPRPLYQRAQRLSNQIAHKLQPLAKKVAWLNATNGTPPITLSGQVPRKKKKKKTKKTNKRQKR